MQAAPDNEISEVTCTNLDYAQLLCAPKQGVATLLDAAWAQARHRMEIIGHDVADTAAKSLGLSRRQVYVLIHRARQGSGLVTDLARGRSGGGKGKGRLQEPIERIIRSKQLASGKTWMHPAACKVSAALLPQ